MSATSETSMRATTKLALYKEFRPAILTDNSIFIAASDNPVVHRRWQNNTTVKSCLSSGKRWMSGVGQSLRD